MKPFRLLLTGLIFFLAGYGLKAQTNPNPFYLNGGNYLFNTWWTTQPAGTYPNNARFHRTSVNAPLLAEVTTSDYTGNYNAAGTNARIDGVSVSPTTGNGFIFYNQKAAVPDNNLGAFVVAMNSVGRTGLTVSFTAIYAGLGDSVAVRLQYRSNTCAGWTDVAGSEFLVPKNAAPAPTTFNFPATSLSALGLDNKPNFQLRWKYYYIYSYSGSTSGAKIRLTNVNVQSSANVLGDYLVTDCVSGGYCVTASAGAPISVPFGYCSSIGSFVNGSTVFTAQLSDAAGSFASPVVLGTTVCNASGYQTIAGTVPAGTVSGAGYRVRVITTSPSVIGNDNGSNFSITLGPADVTSPALSCGFASSTASWTLPVSCYDEVLVVAGPAPVSGTPSGNGSAYTPNTTYGSGTAFGGGFVVYKGTGSNVSVTNLVIGTTYYFKIWVRSGTSWSPGVEVYCSPDPGTFTSVVISAYLNSANVPEEWTELLVLGDDVDMRGWTIRDNNNTQNGWQTPITFNSIPFWQHMRRGTIIMLWHRTLDLFGNPHVTDVNKNDGYIQVDLFNTTYFNGGNVSTSMNLASTMDLVQIRDASSNNVHALGHSTAPVDWGPITGKKLNHAQATVDGEAVFVCPGGSVSAYDGASGTTLTSKSSSSYTFGLPNTCAAGPSTNAAFWSSMREPFMSMQTVTPTTIVAGTPGSVTFSWNSAIDPYPTDVTTGYMILRNTSNSFSPPSDGTVYTTGSFIGAATVLAIINNSTTTTYTDPTVMNGNTYYYRVYAFRYTSDDLNGNSFDANRGRAYNTSAYVSVNWPSPSPLPVTLVSFKAVKNGEKSTLSWVTASEIQNDYFLVEKSTDGHRFHFLGKVKGAGTKHSTSYYTLDDLNPSPGLNYYSLVQVDIDGTTSARRIAVLNYNGTKSFTASVYPNPSEGTFQVDIPDADAGNLELTVFNYLGMKVVDEHHSIGEGYNHFSIPMEHAAAGVYFLQLKQDDNLFRTRLIKNK